MSLVQKTSGSTTGGTSSVSPSLTGVVSGNALILLVCGGGSVVDSTPTDSSGQTWSKANWGSGTGLATASVGIYYLLNANSGTHTLTWSGPSGGYTNYTLLEFSALSALDQAGTPHFNNGNPTSVSSTSITTGTANTAVFSIMTVNAYNGQSNQAITDPPSGYTSINAVQNTLSFMGSEFAYQELTSTATINATWTMNADATSNDTEQLTVSFAKSSGGNTAALTAVSSTAGLGSVNMGAGISKALTSLTTTASLGTLGANISLALTGVSATGSAGNVSAGPPMLQPTTATGSAGTAKANIALALSGNSASGSVSNVGAGISATPSAVTATGSIGTFPQTNVDKPLTGVVSTCSVGTPVPSLATALSAVSSATSVSSVGANVSVALTGVSSTCTVGTVRPPGTQLGPVQATGSVGTLALGVSKAISGVSSTSALGTVVSTPQAAISAVSAAGSAGSVTFGNVVVGLTGVSAGSIVGNVAPPATPDFRNGELFFAQQMALPPYYTGPRPTPNQRGAIFYASGSWTVPPGATNVFVSATAGGGTPLGNAGDQLLHGKLAVNPGDTLNVTMLPNGDVYVLKGSTLLLYLFAGHAYGKIAWQATWGQQSGLPGGFGSGVDAGTPFPPILVFYWN